MSFFSRNIGTIDRGLRIVGGALLVALAGAGTIGSWGYVGAVPLVTGLAGICPLYSLLGLNTCARR